VSEENKSLVRRLIDEVYNRGDLDAADELLATDYVDHNALPGQESGLEGYKGVVTTLRSAFPDYEVTIEDQIAEGDKVVTRYTGRGTHQGELIGIAPTGKSVELTGIGVQRVSGGKLVEEWCEWDQLGMMRQLGVIPEPEQSEEASPT
jgi:steroid delta-isomerase-like uncharacterized protein